VIMIAITPSLNASNLPLFIYSSSPLAPIAAGKCALSHLIVSMTGQPF
jgi:hypothetical protein